MPPRLPAVLFAAALMLLPAASEPPPELIEATEEAATLCASLGGTPAILDAYRTTLDLNGDGRDDFVTDLARLECGGAWSAFCGSSGCPVTAWLSEADGRHTRFEFGRLLGFEVRAGAPQPTLVATYAAPFCGGEQVDTCTRSWAFSSNSPDTPPLDPGPEPAAAPAVATDAPAATDVDQPELTGWSLRRVPGSSPVALGMGIGNIATLAAFCLEDQPFLAVTFHRRPEADSVALRFGFSEGAVDASAGFEETAGGAFVIALAEQQLATRLGGRDSEVAVSIDSEPAGMLSLAGSTRAMRGALADCGGL